MSSIYWVFCDCGTQKGGFLNIYVTNSHKKIEYNGFLVYSAFLVLQGFLVLYSNVCGFLLTAALAEAHNL